MKQSTFDLVNIEVDGVSVLALKDLSDEKMNPLYVNFASGALTYRRTHGFGKGQTLGRAIGLKKGVDTLKVFDATAGLGTDAFMMAALGCTVHAVERSKTVFALLQDGHERLKRQAEESGDEDLIQLVARLTFSFGDAAEILASLNENEFPDVVYVDPMYPEETHSSALPKKSMQMFRRLLEGDTDAEKILVAARRVSKRIVVKRPLKAAPLVPRPRQAIEGKTIRYDIYV
ncbi:MAG TPA: class I SAM-dependent methyltransferase [Bdellovibrionales bacterium]|nr:class I SAM-dependent methyltransferase [Bdellovibrionales bacterium]